MAASEALGRVSLEWGILKSLRRHRPRLWNETKYRRLDLAKTSVAEVERQNSLDLLENGLRNIIMRDDLDALLDGGLDEAAMRQTQTHLESLCDFMDRNVADSDSLQDKVQGITGKYYRLHALLDQLPNTDWAFVMVSGTTRKLFRSISPKEDNKDIGKFNDFFNDLTRPSVADICFPAKAPPFDRASPDIDHQQDQLSATFDGLDVLLSQFKDSLKCQGHRVLLQLPGSNITPSSRQFRESRLELFLSTCGVPPLWLEGQLDTLSSTDNNDLYPIGSQLCDHIHTAREVGDRLYLTVSNKEIFIRDNSQCDNDEDKYSRFYAGKHPSKTLKELLEKGAFNSSIFGYSGVRFTENEKRSLAATLISNLALSLVSSRTIKCWDSDAIYFLAGPNGECIRGYPYALCVYHSKQDTNAKGPNETQQVGLALEDADFELLAKLLLEIRGWSLPSDIALLATIDNEMCKNLGNLPYLQAVRDCLQFRNLYQRHVKFKASKGQTVDAVAAVKHIISLIVRGVRVPIQQVSGHKRQLDDGENSGYAISSERSQLGVLAESRIRHSKSPFVPHYPDISNSQETQAPTKRVRFGCYQGGEQPGPIIGLPPDANVPQSYASPHARGYSPKFAPTEGSRTPPRSRSSGPPRKLSTTPDPLHASQNNVGGSFSNLMGGTPAPPVDNRGFEIAIICALALEVDAVEGFFDKHWDSEGYTYPKAPRDPNAYSTGAIGRHNVVLAHMPTMGKGSAASVAANCRSSFTGIKLALVVGICGAVPFKKGGEEILLGDTVISSGIIQYDFGRWYTNEFMRKNNPLDNLGGHNSEIQALLNKLQTRRNKKRLQEKTSEYLSNMCEELGDEAPYPGEDRLFESDYRHRHHISSGCVICAACKSASDPVCQAATDSNCDILGCDKTKLVSRNRLNQAPGGITVNGQASIHMPTIHFGLVASGDTVMKSGEVRDEIAAKENIIAFEMEGAGVWGNFPCLVIKGVCDYADSHKNKDWQNYAAVAAAACMKAFLEYWPKTSQESTCF
ncbi:hypothetical protein TWF718_009660 [Orbilia javanica]|uniref:Nucleoside phosphorylase domain-containing protein n=1 Tax=Orbilia javanica TaxID=47235 RepID=A0AAN8MZK7_9PEZI